MYGRNTWRKLADGEERGKVDYEKWFFGHYHGNKRLGKSEMLFEGIKELGALHFYRRWVFLYIKKVILCRSKYVKMADKTY